jgi:hypothetical protein
MLFFVIVVTMNVFNKMLPHSEKLLLGLYIWIAWDKTWFILGYKKCMYGNVTTKPLV